MQHIQPCTLESRYPLCRDGTNLPICLIVSDVLEAISEGEIYTGRGQRKNSLGMQPQFFLCMPVCGMYRCVYAPQETTQMSYLSI